MSLRRLFYPAIISVGGLLAGALLFVILIDLGFFWSLMSDGEMRPTSSGGRFQYSLIRHVKCTILSPNKTYRRVGEDAWMSEIISGYWCKSDEDIEKFRATRG